MGMNMRGLSGALAYRDGDLPSSGARRSPEMFGKAGFVFIVDLFRSRISCVFFFVVCLESHAYL